MSRKGGELKTLDFATKLSPDEVKEEFEKTKSRASGISTATAVQMRRVINDILDNVDGEVTSRTTEGRKDGGGSGR
jgi:hypothetical protein